MIRAMREARVGYESHLDAALLFLLGGVFWMRADIDLMLRISCKKWKGTSYGV